MTRNRKSSETKLQGKILKQILSAQENEMTESVVYADLATSEKNPKNRKILIGISEDEKRHAKYWMEYSGRAVKENNFKVLKHKLFAKIFGLTFSVKLMEKGEEIAQANYREIGKVIPDIKKIEEDEKSHELSLLAMLDEERLKYVGSMILGVNDALVELTGTLAGLTLALQSTKLIGMIGFITGFAASLSMAGSEYLSTQAESEERNPLKASIYTGVMYLVTVILLILPYVFSSNVFLALGITLTIAIVVILFFTFYISVAQDLPFKRRFLQMAGISLSVAALTFTIGYVVKKIFGIEI